MMIAKLSSMRDAEGFELRPAFAVSRGELESGDKPIGWAYNARGAARLINKHMAESSGTLDNLRGSDLYWSRPLRAWFPEE